MHSLESPLNQVDRQVVESPELIGRECACCFRVLPHKHFRRDSSSNDGVYVQCNECEATPRLSTVEHTHRLREGNYYSEATKRQRWSLQDEYRNDAARMGKAMHSSEFIAKLHQAVPNLYVKDGNIVGHLALYELSSQPREDWGGQQFRYLFYFEEGLIPEFSLYEFSALDVPIREKKRGWRTVLLRLINSGLLTEPKSDKFFGPAEGEASLIWRYKLYLHRNKTEKAVQ